MTILKSDLESTVTCADIHSGRAVLRFVADIIQIYEQISTCKDVSDIKLVISPFKWLLVPMVIISTYPLRNPVPWLITLLLLKDKSFPRLSLYCFEFVMPNDDYD